MQASAAVVQKDCVHFDVEKIPTTSRAFLTTIRVNGRMMTKSEHIPVVIGQPI